MATIIYEASEGTTLEDAARELFALMSGRSKHDRYYLSYDGAQVDVGIDDTVESVAQAVHVALDEQKAPAAAAKTTLRTTLAELAAGLTAREAEAHFRGFVKLFDAAAMRGEYEHTVDFSNVPAGTRATLIEAFRREHLVCTALDANTVRVAWRG